LPEGDRAGLPPGRRQFTLRSLVWLLTLGAAALASGQLLEFNAVAMVVLLLVTVGLWWRYAELRDEPIPPKAPDAESLRADVERWKADRDRR
jgi:hypothetical protein